MRAGGHDGGAEAPPTARADLVYAPREEIEA